MAAESLRKSPPAPPGHWFWGHTQLIFNDPMGYPVQASLAYKPLCRLRLGTMIVYVTAHAECIRQIFITHTENFVKGPAFKTISLLLGKGLLNSEGDFWRRQRRLAQPAFHKEKLKGFLQTFIDCSKDVALKWRTYKETDAHQMSFEMGELTLRIAGMAMFGIDLDTEAGTIPPDVKDASIFLNQRIYTIPRYPIRWPLPSHKRFFAVKANIDKVVYKIIDDRLNGITAGDDLLQTFIEATDLDTGEKMSREQLRDEVITLFLAGFETTSISLSWVWYMLSQHEEVWKKFRDELENVIGEGDVKPEHIQQLTYTKAIIEETMRLYPPAYYVQRQLVRDMEMQGYHLKKGNVILTSVNGLHRNPDYWEDPESYRPERFMVPNTEKIKGAYMPFGMGQRICIGNQFALLEMLAVLAVLGRQFRLRPAKGYVPQIIPSITSNISEGMPMHIEKFVV